MSEPPESWTEHWAANQQALMKAMFPRSALVGFLVDLGRARLVAAAHDVDIGFLAALELAYDAVDQALGNQGLQAGRAFIERFWGLACGRRWAARDAAAGLRLRTWISRLHAAQTTQSLGCGAHPATVIALRPTLDVSLWEPRTAPLPRRFTPAGTTAAHR